MGGTSCHSSSDSGYSQCMSSYPNDTVLNAGAIVGIVIGSLVGIAFVVLLLVIACKLLKKTNPSSNQQPHMSIYGLPMNTNNYQQPTRRSEMYTPSKPSAFRDTYENI